MADFTISGLNNFTISEPSRLPGNVDTYAFTGVTLGYDGNQQVTIALSASSAGGVFQHPGETAGLTLTKTGTFAEIQLWLAQVKYVANDVELGNAPVSPAPVITLQLSASDVADPKTNTATATINPANDPATLADGNATVLENNQVVLNAADAFKLNDPEQGNGSGPAQIAYTIEEAPSFGYVTLNGTRLGVGSVFSHADVIANRVVYHHTEKGPNENDADAFKVRVNDSATPIGWGGETGPEKSVATITLNVTPVNQDPLLNVTEGYAYEGQSGKWTGHNVGQFITTYAGSDGARNDRDPGQSVTITFTDLPDDGKLFYNGVEVTAANNTIVSTNWQVDREKLRYEHDGDDNDPTDSFKITVGDGTVSTAEQTVTLNIRPVNDNPEWHGAADGKLTATVTGTFTDSSVNLQTVIPSGFITDVDNTNPKDIVLRITDWSGLDQGWIELNGTDLPKGGVFTYQDVLDGKVVYRQHLAVDEEQNGLVDKIKFEIVDRATTVLWDADGNPFELEGGVYDADQVKPGGELKEFELTLNLNPGFGGGEWTPPNNNYVPATNTSEWAGENWGVEPSKGTLLEGGTIILGNGTDPAHPGLKFGVKDSSDHDNDVTPPADQIVYTVTGLKFRNAGEPDNTASGEWNGTLYKTVGGSKTALYLGSTFTQEDLDSGRISFEHDGSEDFKSTASFDVSAGLGVTWKTSFDFYITPINDAPTVVGSENNVVSEGPTATQIAEDPSIAGQRSFLIKTEHLRIADPDDANSSTDYAGLENGATLSGATNYAYNNQAGELRFKITDLPDHGKLQYLNGSVWTDVALNQVLPASLIKGDGTTGLRYLHDGSENTFNDEFTVVSIDRHNIESVADDVTFVITPFNDTPEIAQTPRAVDPAGHGIGTATGAAGGHNAPISGVIEGATNQALIPITNAHLQAVDADNPVDGVTYTINSAPTSGTLYFSTDGGATKSVIAVGGTFTQKDIDDGKIFYGNHGGAEPTSGYEGNPPDGTGLPNPDVKFGFSLSDGTAVQTGREFWIYVDPTNDRPAVAANNSQIIIPEGGAAVPGFSVSDPDSAGPVNFEDFVKVTVRLSNNSGTPLAVGDYAGVTISTTAAAHGADLSATYTGVNGALQLSGTRAEVNAYLAGLKLEFNGSNSNANQNLRIDVIVDDRLRADNGTLLGTANGGQNLKDDKTGTEAPSSNEIDPYTVSKDAIDLPAGQFYKNLDINHRTIFISDKNEAPNAVNDTNTITELLGTLTKPQFPTTQGNVVLGDSKGGNADSDIDQTDTLTVIGVINGTPATVSAANVDVELRGKYGWLTLKSDGSYEYRLDNNHPEVKALKPSGPTLDDEFTYLVQDNNSSNDTAGRLTAQARLTITIDGVDDAPPSITPVDHTSEIAGDNVVSEGGLPGGNGVADSQKTTGAITVKADAGIHEITVQKPDGSFVTLDVPRLEKLVDLSGGYGPVSIDTGEGTLILTKFERVETDDGVLSEATLSYEYILKEKQNHPSDNNFFDTIPLGVVDKEGDTNTGNLVIKIEDDAPKAFNNVNQITEDHSTNAVTGNVVGDVGPGGTDSIGADGAAVGGPVTQIAFGGDSKVLGTSFNSQYGSIVINADGSYTYTLDNNNPVVNALLDTQTLTEEFDYTITDADGDTASAKLIITINGTTDQDPDGPNIQIIGGTNQVYESGLRSDTDADNSQKTDDAQTHVIDVVALDGIGKVEVAGQTFDVAALKDLAANNVVIETPHGKLTLTGFTVDETHDGTPEGIPTKGKISYEYEITVGQTHDKSATPTEDQVFDDVIPLKVISHEIPDKKPAETTGNLTIKIYDDVPEARNDTAGVVEDRILEATGNVLPNDEPGGDGLIVNPVTNVKFDGTDHVPGTTIKTKYGEITLNDDGSYLYKLDNNSPLVQKLEQGRIVTETVRYTIIDKDGDTSEADLVISITGTYDAPPPGPDKPKPENQAPEVVGGPIPEQVDVDSQDIVPVDVTKHFRDPEGGKLTYTVEGLPPSLVFDPETGKITGAPHHSASQQGVANNGIYDVKVTATDPNGASTSFNFKWTVSNVPPYAKDDVARTSPTEIVRGNVVRGDDRGYGRDGDPDQDPFIVSYINNTGVSSQGATVKGSNGGTFTVQRDGSYTFDPGSDFSGLGSTETRKTSITYTIADSDGGTARATLTVTVAGKDVPVGPQPIIPNSDVVITLDHAPALSPDGTPYSTSGTAGQVDELHSDFSVRLSGDAENVVLTGHKAANVWDNASGNVIYGNAGANTIYLSGGRDVVDGGSGYDLLVLSKAKSDYTFDFSKGVAEIRDNATGFIVTAASIEAVSFNGQAVDPVRALYDAYYGRAATEAEYASATTLLKEGVSVAEVGSKLAASSEAQAHIGQGSNADFIKSVYSSVLGRAASDDEAGWWAGQIEQGGVSRTDAVLRFVDSEEFGDRYVSLFTADHSDIAGLYRIVMGRDPDKDGFIFWSQRSAEGETLREIALDFYYSDEFQARISSTSHTDLVTDFYADLLRREPDAEGLAYWVGELDRDQRSAANVAQSILESDEFRQNVDTLLNRADWLDVF